MNKIKISIIVPVYNADKHLDECIKSLIVQDYEDFEIILINDGSNDKSGDICDQYASSYKNVFVYHINNQGVSYARNYGIEQSTGEYLMFIDADDYVDKITLREMSKYFHYDLIISGQIKDFFNNGNLVDQKSENGLKNITIVNELKNSINLILEKIKIDSACCKLYRKSIIEENNIRFRTDLAIREDTIFNINYLKYCSNLIALPNKYYHFRININEEYICKRKPEINYCDIYYEEYYGLIKIYKLKSIDIINRYIFNFYFEYLLYNYRFNQQEKELRINTLKKLNSSKNFRKLIKCYKPQANFFKILLFLFEWNFYNILDMVLVIRLRKRDKK